MVAMVVAQLHQLPYTFTTLRIYTRSYCRFSFATVTSVVLNNKRYLSSELGLRLITTQFPFEPRLKWIANMEISVQISISNTFLPRCVRVYRNPELIDWPRCVSVLLQQRWRNQTFYNSNQIETTRKTWYLKCIATWFEYPTYTGIYRLALFSSIHLELSFNVTCVTAQQQMSEYVNIKQFGIHGTMRRTLYKCKQNHYPIYINIKTMTRKHIFTELVFCEHPFNRSYFQHREKSQEIRIIHAHRWGEFGFCHSFPTPFPWGTLTIIDF